MSPTGSKRLEIDMDELEDEFNTQNRPQFSKQNKGQKNIFNFEETGD